MPVQVNSEALRLVLDTADTMSRSLRDALINGEEFELWMFNEEQRERIKTLDTSIWMLRNILDQHDASTSK